MGRGPILNYKHDYTTVKKDRHDPTQNERTEPEQAQECA